MLDELDAHGVRVAWLARLLCRQLGLSAERTGLVVGAARTHDVGKRLLPVALLDKPGPLTAVERAQMERHCILGANVLSTGLASLDRLPEQAAVALLHHEWWNGQGYPLKLAGRDIPMAARVVAVADVLDALLTRRSYKPAWLKDFAFDYIRQSRGTQFDPECVDALMALSASLPGDWREIALGAGRAAPREGAQGATRSRSGPRPTPLDPPRSSSFAHSDL